jgi:hypothetical protein
MSGVPDNGDNSRGKDEDKKKKSVKFVQPSASASSQKQPPKRTYSKEVTDRRNAKKAETRAAAVAKAKEDGTWVSQPKKPKPAGSEGVERPRKPPTENTRKSVPRKPPTENTRTSVATKPRQLPTEENRESRRAEPVETLTEEQRKKNRRAKKSETEKLKRAAAGVTPHDRGWAADMAEKAKKTGGFIYENPDTITAGLANSTVLDRQNAKAASRKAAEEAAAAQATQPTLVPAEVPAAPRRRGQRTTTGMPSLSRVQQPPSNLGGTQGPSPYGSHLTYGSQPPAYGYGMQPPSRVGNNTQQLSYYGYDEGAMETHRMNQSHLDHLSRQQATVDDDWLRDEPDRVNPFTAASNLRRQEQRGSGQAATGLTPSTSISLPDRSSPAYVPIYAPLGSQLSPLNTSANRRDNHSPPSANSSDGPRVQRRRGTAGTRQGAAMENRPANLTTQTAAAADTNLPPPRNPGASSTSQPERDQRMGFSFLNNNT